MRIKFGLVRRRHPADRFSKLDERCVLARENGVATPSAQSFRELVIA
jgi:hypothetical protein